MKNFQKIIILVLATIFVGCAKKQTDTSKILGNEETRSEIMETIINDDKMISQFMDKMINNDERKLLLTEKRNLINMNQMMQEITNDSIKAGMMMEHMMVMMQKDSSIYRMMHRKMGNNLHMKGVMKKDSTMMQSMHN